jgi:hypothetical protein
VKIRNHLVLSRLEVLAAATIAAAHLGSWISLHAQPSLWKPWDLLSLVVRLGVCIAFPAWSYHRLRTLRARARIEGGEASYPLDWTAWNIACGLGAAMILATSVSIMVVQYLKS